MNRLLLLFIAFFAFACDEGVKDDPQTSVNFMAWVQIESILEYSSINDSYYIDNFSGLSLDETRLANDFLSYHEPLFTNAVSSCLDIEFEEIVDADFPHYAGGYFAPNAYKIRLTSGCREGFVNDPQWVGEIMVGIDTYILFADTLNAILFNALSNNPSFIGRGYVYFDEYGNIL